MEPVGVEDEEGIRIRVKAVPRAKRNQITGFTADGCLRVRLAAPPVDGKANQMLEKVLSENFQVPRADISIIAGVHGRIKTLKIKGLRLREYSRIVSQLLEK